MTDSVFASAEHEAAARAREGLVQMLPELCAGVEAKFKRTRTYQIGWLKAHRARRRL